MRRSAWRNPRLKSWHCARPWEVADSSSAIVMRLPLPIASLSLDLDNQWSYLKTHGDAGWETFPSYLDIVVPRALQLLAKQNLQITFFVVGQDAALEKNYDSLRMIPAAGHEIGNHSFSHEPWLDLYDAQR